MLILHAHWQPPLTPAERAVFYSGPRQATPYAEATKLLVDLRDLAIYQNRLRQFQERIMAIKEKYRSRSALMERFSRAGL